MAQQRQPGLIHRIVKQETSRGPLGDPGAAVGAGNQTHIHPMLFGIGLGKAFGQIHAASHRRFFKRFRKNAKAETVEKADA